MLREFTCIICPNGCEITADIEENTEMKGAEGGVWIRSVEGASCPRGKAYVEQELTDPQRNIATSVLVKGGILPLASVRLTHPVPKNRIFDAMAEIRKCTLTAPVKAGEVVIEHLLGYQADVIVTKAIPLAEAEVTPETEAGHQKL